MYDFIRAASIVPKVVIGDVETNTNEIIIKMKEAYTRKVDIAVFPELCLTGYTCADLFFQNIIQSAVEKSIAQIVEENKVHGNTVIIGAPLVINGQLYNCAVVIANGRIGGIVPKTFLPNCNEFYEKRWFSSSEDLSIDYIDSNKLNIVEEYKIPVGRNCIFSLNHEITFGVEVCEDLWASLSPSCFLALNGAEVMINISASNEVVLKRKYRQELVAQQSAMTLSAYIFTSAGAEESTTDLVFSGHGLMAENGTIIAENEGLIDSNYMLVADLDIGKIKADRMKNKSFKDAASLYGKHEPCRFFDLSVSTINGDGGLYKISKLPFVPEVQNDRLNRCRDIFQMQIAGLVKRLSVTGARPVLGISGGLDSTLALLVSAKAVEQMGRPLTDVIGITMPCFGTTDRTYHNALRLMESLGVTAKEINIKEACLQHFADIGHDENNFDVTFENCQARERTQVLMDYAGQMGGLVVGTGDLSELALGWCTYNADHMSMYGVNSGVPKTLVRWMIDSMVQNNIFPQSTDILKDIIDTPISPELLPPDAAGEIAQKTEDIVGPYALHDFFLYYIIRFGFEPKKVYKLAQIAFADDFDNAVILKWLENFYRRFFSQQFKRSCLPDGVKVGSIGLSPRGDWRMPSDASAALWLSEVEKLKSTL